MNDLLSAVETERFAGALSGASVLVDAYNLQLAQGTGIATYTRTLVRALQGLGAEVGLLYAHGANGGADPVLTEIAFFDRLRSADDSSLGGRRRRLMALAKGIGGYLGLPLRATEIPAGGFVIRSGVPEGVRVLTRPGCYDQALLLNRVLGRELTIDTGPRIDIWHATYPLPVRVKGAKRIVTIHDLVPFRLPYTTLDDKKEQFRRHRHLLHTSDRILTVSEASKRDMVELFDADPERIDVTYQPVDLEPLSEDESDQLEAMVQRCRLRVGGYVLFVGAIEPKKNIKRLIDAFAMIDSKMPLVIVGKKGWMWEQEISHLDSALGRGRFRMLDYVSANYLRYLYAGARCFVFPSLYEGFGLPPLEAMSFGVPVLTSSVASLPEVCGDAALYADPYDTVAIRDQLARLINDNELCAQLRVAGRAQVAHFSMARYRERLAAAYRKVL